MELALRQYYFERRTTRRSSCSGAVAFRTPIRVLPLRKLWSRCLAHNRRRWESTPPKDPAFPELGRTRFLYLGQMRGGEHDTAAEWSDEMEARTTDFVAQVACPPSIQGFPIFVGGHQFSPRRALLYGHLQGGSRSTPLAAHMVRTRGHRHACTCRVRPLSGADLHRCRCERGRFGWTCHAKYPRQTVAWKSSLEGSFLRQHGRLLTRQLQRGLAEEFRKNRPCRSFCSATTYRTILGQ